ncbi:uncharacterized protein BROUX77_003350 [Berkeleyomyces rouxiae]|uniref:uncharacterized protein n=1 Tax=Berkeleyomyces rouxiae TaxID=2035830 RepID=UPI003B8231DC
MWAPQFPALDFKVPHTYSSSTEFDTSILTSTLYHIGPGLHHCYAYPWAVPISAREWPADASDCHVLDRPS